MNETRHLDVEDLLDLVRRLAVGPIRDVGLLDAAAARPRSTAFGLDAYPTVWAKAATLLHSIVTTHPLVDGNKRLGWLATVVFMDINGTRYEGGDDAAFRLVMDVAEGRGDIDHIAEALEAP